MPQPIKHRIVRVTPDRDPIDNEELCVELEPLCKVLRIWCKGRRRKYAVRFSDIYRMGLMQEARARGRKDPIFRKARV